MSKTLPTRGFSLPELMIAMVIGLVLTLVISTMVSRQESLRRGVTSSNDLTGNTAHIAYLLDRELRSAGAGFSQAITENWGCSLNVARNNAQLLPATTPYPAPFAGLPQAYVLAPLVVHAGAGANGSDVIAVATGNSGLSEMALPISPNSATAGQLKLANTLGIRGGDIVLVSQTGPGCMLQQVTNGFAGGATQVLNFDGMFAADTVNGVALTDFSTGTAFVSLLGNVAGNRPRLQYIGLGDNATLMAYDLLQLSGNEPQALAEGIVDMRVRYGIANAAGQVTTWRAPTDDFAAAALTSGSAVALNNLRSIYAVRIGLVVRSDLVERDAVTPSSLTLFSDLDAGTQHSYTVPAGTTGQRYRTVEFTVPLRNIRFSR